MVNASEAGLLIEAIHYIPVGAKVNVAVLFPNEFELDDLANMPETPRLSSLGMNGILSKLRQVEPGEAEQIPT